MKNSYPVRNEDVVYRRIEDEVLLLNQRTKQYHILNESAAMIWEMSDGENTNSQIVDAVCMQYDETIDVIEKDIVQTLEGLEKLGLISME